MDFLTSQHHGQTLWLLRPDGSANFEGAGQAVQWAKKHGVKILWGSDVFFGDDAFAGFTQEFEYRDKFFTPVEQLRQVTGMNGEILSLSGVKNPYPQGPLGVIKTGAYADLILVNGDPTKGLKRPRGRGEWLSS